MVGLALFGSAVAAAQGTLLIPPSNEEIEVENCARVNDREVQFGAALYGDELVYLTRPRAGNVNPATGKTYFKLFRARLDGEGLPGRPGKFSTALSSNYNEGPVSFTQQDQVIYFTRTLQDDGATVEGSSGVANLGLYSAYRGEYDWTGVRELPFNGPNFSNQHPSVTANGRRVFFASNRPGGYGGYDIYFADFFGGRWSAAINLGPDINTEGNEVSPHIHPSGRLFFASDGHGGRGGYDLFLIDLSQRRWGDVVNLPPPVNSPSDDLGISLTPDGKRAYLTSNRAGGMGQDDLYLLRLRRGITSLEVAEVDAAAFTVYDGSTSRRVAGARVWFTEVAPSGRLPADFYTFALRPTDGGREIVPVVRPPALLLPTPLRTDREGTVRLEVSAGKTYELRVAHPGYATDGLRFRYTAAGPSRPLVLTLQPRTCRTVSGTVTDRKGGGVEAVPVQFRPQDCTAASVSTETDVAGRYEICVPQGCGFLVVAGRAGYRTGTATLPAGELLTTDRPVLDLTLDPEGNVSRRGKDTYGAVLPLPGLNFFAGSAILQEKQSPDLPLLLQLLTDRPDLKLEIIAHTDGPLGVAELKKLGEQRAEAIRQALLTRGVAAGRLRTLSHGNTYRRVDCTDCTAADYAMNNRTEARVISY